jgi:hypothetical protein
LRSPIIFARISFAKELAKSGRTGARKWREVQTTLVLLERHRKCKAKEVMGFSLPITGSPIGTRSPGVPRCRGFSYEATQWTPIAFRRNEGGSLHVVESLRTMWPAIGRNRPLRRAHNGLPRLQRLARREWHPMPTSARRHRGAESGASSEIRREIAQLLGAREARP